MFDLDPGKAEFSERCILDLDLELCKRIQCLGKRFRHFRFSIWLDGFSFQNTHIYQFRRFIQHFVRWHEVYNCQRFQPPITIMNPTTPCAPLSTSSCPIVLIGITLGLCPNHNSSTPTFGLQSRGEFFLAKTRCQPLCQETELLVRNLCHTVLGQLRCRDTAPPDINVGRTTDVQSMTAPLNVVGPIDRSDRVQTQFRQYHVIHRL